MQVAHQIAEDLSTQERQRILEAKQRAEEIAFKERRRSQQRAESRRTPSPQPELRHSATSRSSFEEDDLLEKAQMVHDVVSGTHQLRYIIIVTHLLVAEQP